MKVRNLLLTLAILLYSTVGLAQIPPVGYIGGTETVGPAGPTSPSTGLQTTVVGSLPACTTNGQVAGVTDSLNSCRAGNTLTGGGGNKCLVYCDGTNWTLTYLSAAIASGDCTVSATGVSTCSGGSNLLGVIGKVNNQGTIASAGTLSCDLSLGVICRATVGGGAYNIAAPTNGTTGVTYYLQTISTGDVAGTYAAGWLNLTSLNTLALPGTNVSGPAGSIETTPFTYDGTNYQIGNFNNISARRIAAVNFVGAIGNTSQTLSTTSGPIASTTGAHTSTTGNHQITGAGQFIAGATGASSLGTAGTYASTEGTAPTATAAVDMLYGDSTAHAFKMSNNAGTATQVVGTSGGTAEFNLSAGNETYGSNTLYATGQQIAANVATNACHFIRLTCINTFHAATCTTAPTANVFDGASNIGTAQICSSALQNTRATITSVAESQTIAAGDTYGLYISTAGASCLTDQFSISAEIICP